MDPGQRQVQVRDCFGSEAYGSQTNMAKHQLRVLRMDRAFVTTLTAGGSGQKLLKANRFSGACPPVLPEEVCFGAVHVYLRQFPLPLARYVQLTPQVTSRKPESKSLKEFRTHKMFEANPVP